MPFLYLLSDRLTSAGLSELDCTCIFYTGAEPIVNIPWYYLCGSSALGVIFNFAINFGIAYTFPLFISLGTILGIPVNAVVDALVRGVDLVNWKITAMDLIIGGFLLMLMSPSVSYRIQQFLCCRACRRVESQHVICCGCVLPR